MSTFRVRNLLIQVLEATTEQTMACGNASAAECVNTAELPMIGGCGCSLHFDTGCNIWQYSLSACKLRGLTLECVPGKVTLVNKNYENNPEACAELKSGCEQVADSELQAVPPVGVCFRSDEPRLDPTSLADLGVLRRQLAAALKIVQTREGALSEALLPRTPHAVEQAEELLSSALEDLKAGKQHTQSQASGAASRSSKKAASKTSGRGATAAKKSRSGR